jgi:hypothetical protein
VTGTKPPPLADPPATPDWGARLAAFGPPPPPEVWGGYEFEAEIETRGRVTRFTLTAHGSDGGWALVVAGVPLFAIGFVGILLGLKGWFAGPWENGLITAGLFFAVFMAGTLALSAGVHKLSGTVVLVFDGDRLVGPDPLGFHFKAPVHEIERIEAVVLIGAGAIAWERFRPRNLQARFTRIRASRARTWERRSTLTPAQHVWFAKLLATVLEKPLVDVEESDETPRGGQAGGSPSASEPGQSPPS